MGNCQAVEVAAAVVRHPGRAEVERFYSPVSAQQVMASNPGNYVALVAAEAASASPVDSDGRTMAARQQQLKLLRPGDSLMLGHVYCLISFEDVLKEFAAKKCIKLGKMVGQSGGTGHEYDHTMKQQKKKNKSFSCPDSNSSAHPKSHNFSSVQLAEPDIARARGSSSSSRANVRGGCGGRGSLHGGWRQYGGTLSGGQWRPALQSISEIGN